jgi:hypothetical protein
MLLSTNIKSEAQGEMFIEVLCKDLRHHAFQFDTVDELRKVHKLLVAAKKNPIVSTDTTSSDKGKDAKSELGKIEGVSNTVLSYKPFEEVMRQGIAIMKSYYFTYYILPITYF